MSDRASYEHTFRRAGLPLFIADYSAREDVFNRAIPFLSLVFVLEVFGTGRAEWSLGANVAATFGGLLVLLGLYGLLNRARGKPVLSIPERIGYVELAAFVVLPSLLPLIFGGDLFDSGETVLLNIAILAVVYAVVGLGLLSILRWAGARALSQLATSLGLVSRAIPLLIIFILIIFINTEMWQVFAFMSDENLIGVIGLLVALGVMFVIARLPREVGALEAGVVEGPPLDRPQRLNVGLVLFVSHALRILIVGVVIGLFLTVLGALMVGPEVLNAWIRPENLDELGITDYLEDDIGAVGGVTLTEVHLRVALGIATFSSLYFAVAAFTESAYREEFLEELTREMRDTFDARAEYLRRLDASR